MKFKLLPFLLLAAQLAGCSGGLDERFYGTWIEPFGQTEPVIFRHDGTVSWFGEEGTFEPHTWRTDCLPPEFCYHRTHYGLELTLPSGTRQIVPDFENVGDAWWLKPGEDQGGWGDSWVLLFRESRIALPFMPAHFHKLGEGWGFWDNKDDEGNGYCDDRPIVSTNPVRARDRYSYYAYNDTTNSWDENSYDDEVYVFGRSLIVKSTTEEGNTRWDASLDNGVTWEALPPRGESECHSCGENAVTATTFVKMVETTDDHYEIWTIDVASESPSWALRTSFDSAHGADLYVHPTNGLMLWSFGVYEDGEDSVTSEISHDFGSTWQSFDYYDDGELCNQTRPDFRAHAGGFLCATTNVQPEAGFILWYDSSSRTWTNHTLMFRERDGIFDGFVTTVDLIDGVYIRRENRVLEWQPDGTETLVTTITPPPEVDRPVITSDFSREAYNRDIYVFDDQVIVRRFGFWRIWR